MPADIDIDLNGPNIAVTGNVGIGIGVPVRPLHVEGSEMHSGGADGGYSFSDRAHGAFVNTPTTGQRWVWYANNGIARLWSGYDVLQVSYNSGLAARVSSLTGSYRALTDQPNPPPAQLVLFATDIILSKDTTLSTATLMPPYALSVFNNTLVINSKGGFNSGVEVVGKVNLAGNVNIEGTATVNSSLIVNERLLHKPDATSINKLALQEAESLLNSLQFTGKTGHPETFQLLKMSPLEVDPSAAVLINIDIISVLSALVSVVKSMKPS